MEATGRKVSSDAKTEEDNVRETSKVAGGEAGGEDLDSGAALTGISVSTKMIQEEGKRVTQEKSIDDFSGTPKWCLNCMKGEGLSMRI